MTISYQHNQVSMNGESYNLDDIRQWVVDNHPHALAGHHIKTSVKTKKRGDSELTLTYDWKIILNESLVRLYILAQTKTK